MIDKRELIERILYSSKYNIPCPAWVYKLIEATPDEDCTHPDADFIIHLMADTFEQPCNVGINGISIDEWMLENEAEWCEEHCGKATHFDCWKKFLSSYKAYIDSWHEV